MIAFDTDSCSQCYRRFNCEVVYLCQFYLGNWLIMDAGDRKRIREKIMDACGHIKKIELDGPFYTVQGTIALYLYFSDIKVKMEQET